MIYDKRAVKILFDTYWSSKGWKSAVKPGRTFDTPPADLAFAKKAGLMFPPRTVSHQDVLERIVALRAQILPIQVGSAFIASLSANQPALRSALGSYAVALNMPLHSFSLRPGSLTQCSICGAYEIKGEHDLNVLNFERHKWGGVRHVNPVYIAFDLERFTAEASDSPSTADSEMLNSILRSLESMPVGAKLSDLLGTIKPIMPGNDAQRRTILGILGFAGVLRIPGYSGFFRSFTPERDREHTPWSKDDWAYPIRWWRGGNGIDKEAVAFWFGQQ
jgi:hypothetical protein